MAQVYESPPEENDENTTPTEGDDVDVDSPGDDPEEDESGDDTEDEPTSEKKGKKGKKPAEQKPVEKKATVWKHDFGQLQIVSCFPDILKQGIQLRKTAGVGKVVTIQLLFSKLQHHGRIKKLRRILNTRCGPVNLEIRYVE